MISSLLMAFGASVLLVPLIMAVSVRFGWFDKLNERKIHAGSISRLGGVAIATATLLGVFVCVLFFLPAGREYHIELPVVFLGVGMLGMHVIGVADDFRNISAKKKLALQILVGIFVLLSGAGIFSVQIPFTNWRLDFGMFGPLITLVWIIAVTNAVNLIDGMDGLAGGLTLIATIGISALHFVNGNEPGMIISLALIGSLVGFLLFNKPKAKIFMGDGGAYFLGIMVAMLPFVPESLFTQPWTPDLLKSPLVRYPAFLTVESYGQIDVTMVGMLLTLPLGDMVAAILRRMRRRLPFHLADREHLHHKFLDLQFSVPKILLILYSVGTVFAGLAVLAQFFARHGQWLLYSCTISGSLLVAVLFFTLVHLRNRVRKGHNY